MSGSEVPLGQQKILDVLSVSGPPQRVSGGKSGHVPAGLMVLTLSLPDSTVEIAAEPSVLEKLQQQVLRGGPPSGRRG